MSAPFVLSRVTGRNDSGGTTHSILLPTGSPGDLLLVVFGSDGSTTVTVNQGPGWNKLGERNSAAFAQSCTQAIFWKKAQGGDFLTLKTSSSQQTNYIAYRIVNGGTATGSFSNGDFFNDSPNPPSHTTNLPDKEYLWIATRTADKSSQATGAPSNFFNLVHSVNPDSDNGTASAAAEHTTFSETVDPGSFPPGNISAWVCATICIAPPVNNPETSAFLVAESQFHVAYGAGSVSPRTASLVATSKLKVEKKPALNKPTLVDGIKASFDRPDHDWRMTSASHYEHTEVRSETIMIEDPNDPEKFLPQTVQIRIVHRTEIFALESQPLGIGVSFQSEFTDGVFEGMIMHFDGCTYDIFDHALLQSLQEKGFITKESVLAIFNDLVSNDPPPIIEEE